MNALWKKYLEKEKQLAHFLRRYSIPLLRYSMAGIYFWFGFLKIIDISAVEELVEKSVFWLKIPNFFLILGFWEVAIGLCLFIKSFNRLGLLLFFLQLPGTFLPVFLASNKVFTHFPYGLTLEGQFVFKNIILIAVGLVLVGSLHKNGEDAFK